MYNIYIKSEIVISENRKILILNPRVREFESDLSELQKIGQKKLQNTIC